MKIIRIGICTLLAFSILAHGAVEPWSEAVLEVGAAILLVWWGVLWATGVARVVRWNWMLSAVAGLWAVAVVQYFGRLSTVNFLTKIEILKLSALGILFLLAIQAFKTLEDWHGFVWFLLVLGFLVSLFGILQYFTFNGKMYWFRELRYGGIPFGPYVNRNHFAGMVELIVPSGLAILVMRAFPRDRLALLAVLTLLPIGALFLAASRGGIIGFFLGFALVVVLTFLRRPDRKELLAGAMVLVVVGGLVAWLGIGPALDRFASYRRLEVTDARRAEVMRDSLRIFVAHPLLGTGLGTIQEVFPRYETLYDGLVVNHSHNDYVELLAETGLVGGLFGSMFLAALFAGAWKRLTVAKNPMDLAFHIGAFSACCSLLAHSFVDFNLHIPSNAFLFLLQVALATSAMPSIRSPEPSARRTTSRTMPQEQTSTRA